MAHIKTAGTCPVDKRPLGLHQLIEGRAESESVSDEAEVLARQKNEGLAASMGAAKTRQLIEILQATEAGVKSLVFSQVRPSPPLSYPFL